VTRRKPLSLMAALGLVSALAGCGRGAASAPAQPLMEVFRTEAREAGLTRIQTSGKRLFAAYCATCHGDTGGGDGQNAYNLDPKPPDFHASLSMHPQAYWRQVVEGGTTSVARSPLCPPWGRSLTSSQIDAVVAYLAVLAKPSGAQQPAASAPSGVRPTVVK
jgi:mono/diheme cytochrome c family protein